MAYGESTFTHSDGYSAPFPEADRCAARRKQPPNDRCKKRACTGLRVCVKHGGATPPAVDKRERIKAMDAMRQFVTPIDGDDIEANPIAAFEMEFRRTIARIRYLDEILAELNPEDLGWGTSKETIVGSGEYPGTDVEKVAQANIYYSMQLGERKHLVTLVKIWIGAKLDVRKLEIEEQKVNALNGVIEAVLTKLGHDIKNPEVRRTVRESMLALPTAGSDVIATAKDIAGHGRSLVSRAVQDAELVP